MSLVGIVIFTERHPEQQHLEDISACLNPHRYRHSFEVRQGCLVDICDTGLGIVFVEYAKGPVVVTGDDEFAASVLADLVHHRPYRVGGDVLFRGE